MTVGKPSAIFPPCAVVSPILAAGRLLIMTVALPLTMLSGGPTQTHRSPTTAAGTPPISTFGTQGPEIGPPTCGIGGRPGVTMGQTCMSVILAAGGMVMTFFSLVNHDHGAFYRSLTSSRQLCTGGSFGDEADVGCAVDIETCGFDIHLRGNFDILYS